MLRWAEFERADPELARLGRERFERFGFLFVATVRSDGGPRVNPVEAYVVDGHLVLNMMWRSLKARDLLRDPRAYLHTPITDRLGAPGEFKLTGRALPVEDPALLRATADAIEAKIAWRPPERSHFFTSTSSAPPSSPTTGTAASTSASGGGTDRDPDPTVPVGHGQRIRRAMPPSDRRGGMVVGDHCGP